MSFGNVPLEEGLADHLLQLRLGLWVAQELFREEEDQGLTELALILTAEDVELGRLKGAQ